MDDKLSVQRKAYQKPEVSRVDLVEDEVALAACKKGSNSSHATPNAGYSRCRTSCMTQSAT